MIGGGSAEVGVPEPNGGPGVTADLASEHAHHGSEHHEYRYADHDVEEARLRA